MSSALLYGCAAKSITPDIRAPYKDSKFYRKESTLNKINFQAGNFDGPMTAKESLDIGSSPAPDTSAEEVRSRAVRRGKFEAAAKPLMDYLLENEHPHKKVVVTNTDAELLEGQLTHKLPFDRNRPMTATEIREGSERVVGSEECKDEADTKRDGKNILQNLLKFTIKTQRLTDKDILVFDGTVEGKHIMVNMAQAHHIAEHAMDLTGVFQMPRSLIKLDAPRIAAAILRDGCVCDESDCIVRRFHRELTALA